MEIAIGFVVAVLVGLTGVGGGSFTMPMLVLLCGISGAEAVGTALIFSTVIKVVAAPFFLAAKKVHFRYLRLMLLGALPGLLGGTYILATMRVRWNPLVLVLIGATLVVSALLTFIYRRWEPGSRGDSAPWLPWVTLPIGIEAGFSSAGAGALGTLLLFNCSNMSAAEVVGTDILFGIVLAATGSVFHLGLGSVSGVVLKPLLLGGIPGVLLGCAFTRKVPSMRLKAVITYLTLALGLQLLWTGAKLFKTPATPLRSAAPAKVLAPASPSLYRPSR
jgi:uncharacterized membrane protein YfcA